MQNKIKKFTEYKSGLMSEQDMATFQAEMAVSPALQKEYFDFRDGLNTHFNREYLNELFSQQLDKKEVVPVVLINNKTLSTSSNRTTNSKEKTYANVISILRPSYIAYAASFLILVVAAFWINDKINSEQKQAAVYANLNIIPPVSIIENDYEIRSKEGFGNGSALLLAMNEVKQKGIIAFKNGINSKNGESAANHFSLAQTYLEQYLANPEMEQKDYFLYLYAGRAAFETKRYELAIRYYKKGKSFHNKPNDHPYWKVFYDYQIALALLHNGNCKEAINLFTQIQSQQLDRDMYKLQEKLNQNLLKLNCE